MDIKEITSKAEKICLDYFFAYYPGDKSFNEILDLLYNEDESCPVYHIFEELETEFIIEMIQIHKRAIVRTFSQS